MTCSCCAGESLDIFSVRFARRAMRRYLRKGLGSEEKRMARWATESGLEGRTVMEVGGGVGALQAELLRNGAASGTVVELVDTYRPFARQLAESAGVAERTAFVLADILESPNAVPPADIVSLRRVVCCDPRGPELLAAAAALTREILVVSYPRDLPFVRVGIRVQNALFAVVRKRFRVFAHAPAQLEAAAVRAGLHRVRGDRGRVWESAAFARDASSIPSPG